MRKCPECGSEKIIVDARLLERGDGSEPIVVFDANPSAMVFKKRANSDITANVCGDCGFIRFYAKHPRNLWTAYQKQKDTALQLKTDKEEQSL